MFGKLVRRKNDERKKNAKAQIIGGSENGEGKNTICEKPCQNQKKKKKKKEKRQRESVEYSQTGKQSSKNEGL